MIPEVAIFTGSRRWLDPVPVAQALDLHRPGTIVIHGDCAGLDKLVAGLARMRGWPEWPLPYFERDGDEARNASMVAVGVALQTAGHLVRWHAFPLPDSRGTWRFVRLARAAGLLGAERGKP